MVSSFLPATATLPRIGRRLLRFAPTLLGLRVELLAAHAAIDCVVEQHALDEPVTWMRHGYGHLTVVERAVRTHDALDERIRERAPRACTDFVSRHLQHGFADALGHVR